MSITDAGREVVAQVGARFAERIKDCAAPLTEADRKRLSRLATRLVTADAQSRGIDLSTTPH